MKRTRICHLLGIEYPIIQGAMGWISGAELAAAVSNAGGLGMISPFTGSGAEENLMENLRGQIRKARSLCDKPFGVNIGLEVPQHKEFMDVAIEEGVKVITTAAGSPRLYTRRLKQAGVTVLHTVFSARHARIAEEEGVDVVIASGCDAGGFISPIELPTFALVPQVVDAVKIPVIAAGGIADVRGLVAALALGAEGVQMGTRFIATNECLAHPSYKEAILNAADTDTLIAGRKGHLPSRNLKNEFALAVLEMESAGTSAEELEAFIGSGRLRLAALEGNMRDGSVLCGAVAGMINGIVPAGDVVRALVEGYDAVVSRLM